MRKPRFPFCNSSTPATPAPAPAPAPTVSWKRMSHYLGLESRGSHSATPELLASRLLFGLPTIRSQRVGMNPGMEASSERGPPGTVTVLLIANYLPDKQK